MRDFDRDTDSGDEGDLRANLTAQRERAKASPGPYSLADYDEDRLAIKCAAEYVIGDALFPLHGRQLGSSAEGFAEAQANARLFAAAWDLLAAAKAVREACMCDPDINPEWNAAWDSLVAAIEKAGG